MYNKQASGQQGFTLVELLIVIAIVAIVASIAVPSFTNFVNKNRVKRAAEEVYALVAKARADSVIRDTEMYLSVTGAGADWCVGYSSDSAGCDCTEDDGDEITCTVPVGDVEVVHVVNSADFDNVTLAGNFNDGTSFDVVKGTAKPGSVTLSSGPEGSSWDLSVTVARVGRVRICAADESESTMGFVTCTP